MKKISTLLAAMAVSAAANAVSAETVYSLPGDYQGWILEQNIFADNGDGTLSQHIDELSGSFKIVRYEAGSSSWDDQWGSNGEGVKAGEDYTPAFKNGGPDPANLVLAGSSTVMRDVTVTITPGDNNALTLHITAAEVIDLGDLWYLTGDATQWGFGTTNQFTKGEGNVYTFAFEGTFTGGFKPVKNGAWSNGYVYLDAMELGVEYTLSGPADTQSNCSLSEDSVENPVFTLTEEDGVVTLKVTVEDSGVKAIEADAVAGEAVYYNLQGQRVANPENGLFIRLQGGKASKVAL